VVSHPFRKEREKDGAPGVWGIVHYEDMFGGKHFTKFGQILTWQLDGKTVMGYYIAGQNDGD
jgi:hypothetical protein